MSMVGISRMCRQDVYDRYYTEMLELYTKNLDISSLRDNCFMISDIGLIRMDLIEGLWGCLSRGGWSGGWSESEAEGDIDGVVFEEYKRILFAVIDMFSTLNSYKMVETSITFRRNYFYSFAVREKVRRELRVEKILDDLACCYSMAKSVVDVFEYRFRRGIVECGIRGSDFSRAFCDMMFMSSKIGVSYQLLREICNKVARWLYYKEFIVLRYLLFKFDFPVVECISKYYIDSDKYICFADIMRGVGVGLLR